MQETCEQAGSFLQSVLEKAGFELEVATEQAADRCLLNLDGRDAELLQAEGGELLESLQHLVIQAFGRNLPEGQRIVCDVHGFRATRETELRAMALHAAAHFWIDECAGTESNSRYLGRKRRLANGIRRGRPRAQAPGCF